jgi:hypothetical protein
MSTASRSTGCPRCCRTLAVQFPYLASGLWNPRDQDNPIMSAVAQIQRDLIRERSAPGLLSTLAKAKKLERARAQVVCAGYHDNGWRNRGFFAECMIGYKTAVAATMMPTTHAATITTRLRRIPLATLSRACDRVPGIVPSGWRWTHQASPLTLRQKKPAAFERRVRLPSHGQEPGASAAGRSDGHGNQALGNTSPAIKQ